MKNIPKGARPIHGYDGYFITHDARAFSTKVDPDGREIFGRTSEKGYLFYYMRRPGGARRDARVLAHRLVLMAHVGPAPEGRPLALHSDGDKTNNHVDNLRWGSAMDNVRDAQAHGTHNSALPVGTDHHCARLTPDIVRAIRASSRPQRELAAMYGVEQGTISAANTGRTWGHVQ
jgi:hypothetical protein